MNSTKRIISIFLREMLQDLGISVTDTFLTANVELLYEELNPYLRSIKLNKKSEVL